MLPKFDRDPFIARPLNAETGFVWAVVDSTGRVGLGIRTDGTVVGKIVVPDVAGSAYLLPKRDIWCLGDSLTAGAGGRETWVQRLAAHYPERRISNWGIGGQTSTQIAARAGAFVSLLTVIGDQIPTTGVAQIAGRSVNLLTAQGCQSIRGWLGGCTAHWRATAQRTPIRSPAHLLEQRSICLRTRPLCPMWKTATLRR